MREGSQRDSRNMGRNGKGLKCLRGGGDRTRERKKEEGLRGNEKAEVVT